MFRCERPRLTDSRVDAAGEKESQTDTMPTHVRIDVPCDDRADILVQGQGR